MKKLLGFFLAVFILVSPALAMGGNTVVYITRTGECYHTGSCRHLKKSKIEITLADAVARGYRACKVCCPPSLDGELTAAVPETFDSAPSSVPSDTPSPSPIPTASPSPTPSPTSAPSPAGLADTASAKVSDSEKSGVSGIGGIAILAAGAYALTKRRAKKK